MQADWLRVRLGYARRGLAVLLLMVLGSSLTLTLSGCAKDGAREASVVITGGDPEQGRAAIGRYGCGACHTIPRIRAAKGTVGPPLTSIATRSYLAGHLENSPANMMVWLQHPQHVVPGTAMPEMHVTERDARDITAFLYTLR